MFIQATFSGKAKKNNAFSENCKIVEISMPWIQRRRGDNLTGKSLILQDLKRRSFNFISQFVTGTEIKVLIYQAFPVSAGIRDAIRLGLHYLTTTDPFNDIASRMNTAGNLFLVVLST